MSKERPTIRSLTMLAGACIAAGVAGNAVLASDAPPLCTRATLGQLTCQAGVRCECTYVRESAMTERPGGYQWDCGIKRPRCEAPPATLDPWMGPYPSSIGIDRTNIYEYPPERYPRERGRGRDRDWGRDWEGDRDRRHR